MGLPGERKSFLFPKSTRLIEMYSVRSSICIQQQLWLRVQLTQAHGPSGVEPQNLLFLFYDMKA